MNSRANNTVVATKRALNIKHKISAPAHSSHPHQVGPNSPLKSPKHDRRLNLATVPSNIRARLEILIPITNIDILGAMMPHGERDESGEPEEHSQGVQTEHGDRVGDGGEEARGEGEIDEDEEGPDGGEDHEAVFGGGDAVGCDWEGGFVSSGLSAERGWGG